MRKKYVRVGFTAAQSSELWDRWRKGEGLKSIGRVLGKPSSCIFNHLRPSGGICPAERTRSRLALTLAEREEISRGIVVGQSLRSIAGSLGRSPSRAAPQPKPVYRRQPHDSEQARRCARSHGRPSKANGPESRQSSAATVRAQGLWRSPHAQLASTPTWSASSLQGEPHQTASGD